MVLVEILVYEDCSFIFVLKILFAVVLIKKVVGVECGLSELYKIKVGFII